MPAAPASRLDPRAVGIGLRQPHLRALFEHPPALGFVEVHAENYFAAGGAAPASLERARALWPVSLHGVGLALGSADGLDTGHLERLAQLVERVAPVLVSEHLCWGHAGGLHFNDLLPMPRTHAALALMTARVQQVQERLGRQILVENVSAYVAFADADWSEGEFLAELSRRSGCGLLLDVNNLHVNAMNFGDDPHAALAALPIEAVHEIHLAGHHVADDGFLVDTHDTHVCDAVWSLYAAACRRFGAVPTLVEWDASLPAAEVLLAEAARAGEVRDAALEEVAA